MTNNNNDKNLKNNEQNSKNTGSDKKKKKKKKRSIVGTFFTVLFLLIFSVGVAAAIYIGQMAIGILATAPEIDPENMLSTLSQSSVIVDQSGAVIEQIHDPNENRDIVSLDQIPLHLQQAFIAVEDQRFETHFGIDLRRIAGALVNNFQEGDMTDQGASTITQQLIKNVYLTNTQTFERKLIEMYLAIKVEQVLEKDEILENYLNTIPFGQSASGVQSAAYAYFAKDVSELTLAESALLSAAPNSTSSYSPFFRVELTDLEGIPEEDIVGHVYIGSIQYACVYNQTAIERQHLILDEMVSMGFITEAQANVAKAEDMRAALEPGEKKIEGVTSNNFTDYVTETVVEDLATQLGLSIEDAEQYLYKGGLTVYSTMDVSMQRAVEAEYENFVDLFVGENPPDYRPVAQDWNDFRWSGGTSYGLLDAYDNILNKTGQVLYFDHDNILTEDDLLYFDSDEYYFDDSDNLIIDSNKINIYSYLDIVNCYTITENNELKTHTIGGLSIGTGYEIIEDSNGNEIIKISNTFLSDNPDFYNINTENEMIIDNGYYLYDDYGILQPQSAAVILDYRTGHIKAIVGGRDIEGSKTFNRAVDSARQPGSTIKPLSVLIPALDRGFTAASVFDDVPLYNEAGNRYPINWYDHHDIKYRGLSNLRYSIQQSLNTVPYMLVEEMGVETVVSYFEKMGLIDAENPENDTFVTREENYAINDMFASALALGGFSQGFSPLDMTAAYGVIANDGVYVEPICYTKVLDSNGEILIENIPDTEVVVTPEVAFIAQDILVGSVSGRYALAGPARMTDLDIPMAAKTGTTQADGDLWAIGFSPYYAGGVWIGNDEPTMTLSELSSDTARVLGALMTAVHQDHETADFDVPSGIISVQVCQESGLLPNEHCEHDPRGSQVISEYFIEGSQPKETCTTHVTMSICSLSGNRLSEFCPEDHKEEKVFIQRETLYDPYAYPDYKPDNFEEIYQSVQLYKQILDDIRVGMTARDLFNMYLGQITMNVYDAAGNMMTDANGDGLPDYLISTFDGETAIDSDPWQRIEILTINGFTTADLDYPRMVLEDSQYQVPLDICSWHNYQTWYNSVTNPSGDSLIDNPRIPDGGIVDSDDNTGTVEDGSILDLNVNDGIEDGESENAESENDIIITDDEDSSIDVLPNEDEDEDETDSLISN